MLIMENGDDATQITVEKFAQLVGISTEIVEKLKKNPVFEINPAKTKPDKLNGGIIAPSGKGSKPYFFLEIDGLMTVIRYYEARVPDKTNPRISTYEPKRVIFEDQLSIYPKLDHALFMYALPACADSPNAKSDWHYSFQNKEKKATATRDNAAKISKALALVNNEESKGGLSDGEIMIVAKGIYAQNTGVKVIPNPSQKNKTVIEVRADLTDLIFKDVDTFLDSTDSDVNEFYGMVLDAVDRGIFGIRNSNNSSIRSWHWEAGAMKDKLIVDIQPGQNDFEALKGAIEADPNKYYQFVLKAVKEAAGKENIASFIKGEKAKAARPEVHSHVDTTPVNLKTTPPSVTTPSPVNDELQDDENEDLVNPPENEDDDIFDIDNDPDITGVKKTDPVFVAPKNFNEAARLLRSFNGGKFEQHLNKKFWDGIKEDVESNTLTLEKMSEVAKKVVAGEI